MSDDDAASDGAASDASAGVGHLGLDALADVLAGERAADPHLSACLSCTARLAELEAADAAVVASLVSLRDPALPDGLTERLDAALRNEPPLRPATDAAAGAAAGAATGPTTVTPLGPRRRRHWLPVAVAASLVLVGSLGVSALRGVGDAGTSADTAAPAAGAAESAADGLARNASGTDYADEAAVQAVLPGVLAGRAVQGAPDEMADSSARAMAPAVPAQPPAPGQSDDAAQLSSQAAATPPAPVSGEQFTVIAVDPLARLREPVALAACLSALLPPEEPDLRPLALDYARWSGQPALAVVLPDPDATRLSVYVVGAACSAADAAVLAFNRVAKPQQ